MKLSGRIKAGGVFHPFISNPECLICQAYEDGKNIRTLIDKYIVSNSIAKTRVFLSEKGIYVGEVAIESHIKRHSAFIKEIKKAILESAKKVSLAKLDSLEDEFIEAEDVLTDIINIGGNKIRSGEMAVDRVLLLGALKEQGTRKQQGRLRDLLDELDSKRFIEGEVVDDENIT